MKYKLLTSIALFTCITACNDDYSKQFNINYPLTDTLSRTILLTNDAYAAIASNDINKQIAKDLDKEDNVSVAALEAVGKNKYFTDEASAETYLPAYLSKVYPFADKNTIFKVTYNQYQQPSDYLENFSNLSLYTLTENDYATAWDGLSDNLFLAPSTLVKIPSLLKTVIANPVKGQMVVANYAFSTLQSSSEIVKSIKISDVLQSAEKVEYTVSGEVIASNARGFLLKDKSGTILIYQNAFPNYALGDNLTITGITSNYNGLNQLTSISKIVCESHSSTFSFPSPQPFSSSEINTYASAPSIKYVKLEGKLIKNETNYLLNLSFASYLSSQL